MVFESIKNFFWSREIETNALVYDYTMGETSVDLHIKVTLPDHDHDIAGNLKVVAKERHSENEHIFDIDFKEFSNSAKFGIAKISNDIFKNEDVEIWDFYLRTENGKNIRIKEFITHQVDFTEYVLNKTTRIQPYSTVRGNFSIKVYHNKISALLENIDSENHSILIFEGSVTGLNVDYDQINFILYNLYSSNEYKDRLHIVKDNKELLFKQKVNLQQIPINGNEYDLYIEVISGDSIERIPLSIIKDEIITDKNIYVKEGEHDYKIEFIEKTEKKHLAIFFVKQEYVVNIKEVLVNEEIFSIKGTIICHDDHNFNGQYELLIKRRDGFEEIQEQIQIKNNEFSFSLPVKKLIGNNILFNGVWDLYLRLEGELYPLLGYLKGVQKLRDIIQFPQVSLTNRNGEIKAVKPYYTLYNGLSILVRNYISDTRIRYVIFEKQYVEIVGYMNIQLPNENIPEKLTGFVTARLPYGRKLKLPAILTLVKRKRKLLQFNFNMRIEIDDETKNQLYEGINFDLIKFSIDFPQGMGIFYLNILPSQVVNKTEKFILERPRLKNILHKAKLKTYYLMNKVLPIDEKTIIFQATTGMNYSCNPRAIYEELLNLGYKMKGVWVVNRAQTGIKGNPIIVKPNTLKYYYYMATGKYFVNNGNFPDFYEKRKGTVHLQTWHGTPLKRLGFDIHPSSPSYEENTSEKLLRRIRRWDYLIAPNEYTGEILQRAFKYKNKMLNVGYPRNDIFYKQEEIKKNIAKNVREYLNIPADKKVILYAPTWRDYEFHTGQANEPYNFKFRLEKFAEKFGGQYVLLIRLHPREAVRCQIDDFENMIYNVSNYDDIKDLYLISDILITDYSSVMFDFANTRKPIIFFAHDINRYSSTLRGFYFNLEEEAPGPIVRTESELFKTIENIDKVYQAYKGKYDRFYQKFCSWEDGSAAKRVIDAVFTDLAKGEF